MMFIFCCLKHKHKITKICAYNGSEIKPGETVNIDYTEYTEYCHNHQNESTIENAIGNNTNEGTQAMKNITISRSRRIIDIKKLQLKIILYEGRNQSKFIT